MDTCIRAPAKLEVTSKVRYVGRHIHYQPRKSGRNLTIAYAIDDRDPTHSKVGTLFRFN